MVRMRVQGWDPVLIISQIICLQTIHYLTLSFLVPPLLSGLTTPALLTYSGGPSTTGHILDWREMAARPAVPVDGAWAKLRGAWSGGKKVGKAKDDAAVDETDYGVDERRGWLIGLAWIVACAVDVVPLYYLIRRPTAILDFSLTLNFLHLIVTCYYAKSFPTSLFFWVVQALGAILMIVVGEQLCVKREMSSDLDVWSQDEALELTERERT